MALTRTQPEPGRVPLSRDRVLRAALDYVDAHGLESLSMRKLAAELGVQGMSLYAHVNGKDALLDGLVEAMTSELQLPSPAAESDWRAALREFAASLRDMIHRHPSAASLLSSRHVQPARRLEVLDAYLQLLERVGIPEVRAREVLRAVQVYAQGHGHAEVSWGLYGRDPVVPDDKIARMRWVADMVPRDAPDRLARVALEYCADCDMNRQFQVGLDLMIRGLEAECPRAAG